METATKKKNYYYFIIVAMTFLMMFVGTQTSASFSIMVNAIRESVGLSGSESSAIFMVKNLSAFIFVFFATKYYEKLGLRLGVSLAFIYGLVAMVVFSFAGSNIAIIYVAAVILGAAYAFTMMLPMALIIRRWFNKSRAFAMSFCAAGTGLSGFIMSPILQGIVNDQGVSSAFIFMAAVFAVVAVVFFLLVRNDPSDVGLEPYGGTDYVEESKKGAKKGATSTNEKAVLAFVACACIMGLVSPPSQSHFVMQFNTLGYDSMVAAGAYSFCGLALLFSKIGFGALSEKVPFGALSVAFLSLYVVSLGGTFFMGGMPVTNWMPYAVCVIFGIAGAVCSLGYTNWIADFTTREDYGTRVKNAQFAYQGGEIVGAMLPGMFLDWTGQYSGYYGLAALAIVVVMVIVGVTYATRKKQEGVEEINGHEVPVK